MQSNALRSELFVVFLLKAEATRWGVGVAKTLTFPS